MTPGPDVRDAPDAPDVSDASAAPDASAELGDDIDRAIHQLARTIVRHPLAAQAAYRALVREGRAFATTDEGGRLRARLAGSALVARLRTAWELVTLGMLRDDAAPGALPSVLVDALVQAALRDRFEARLHDAMLRPEPGARAEP